MDQQASALRLGLVGLGKIARDQHLPAIAATPGLDLVAIASRNAGVDGLPLFPDVETMLAEGPPLDAVILCQPPQPRFQAARAALLAGKHVFLEKPPGATVAEVQALAALAERQAVTLFASWHSRFAAGVAAARDWLEGRAIRSIRIDWKEDVRHWHPGQAWIWQAGGFGVFDPGINALSILTALIDDPVRVTAARLETPGNCQSPIAAALAMATAGGTPIEAVFDFRQTGPQTWDIAIEAEGGQLLLRRGGSALEIDGVAQMQAPDAEYRGLYRRFAALVAAGRSEVDLAPLQLVADAFLCGEVTRVADFHE